MKTEAVVFTAPNEVQYTQVDCPDPGPDDVVVRTTHSWISNGTEGSYLRGERSDGDRPYVEGDKRPFPVVAGYQRIGVAEWVGANVPDMEPGETVFATIGRVNGMHHWYGGQLAVSVSPKEHVWKLPTTSVEPLAFAGLVLTQVGYNAGMRPSISDGEPAVVIGDGLVGQWTAQTLLNRGARVLMVGRHDERLAHIEKYPSAIAVNGLKTNWIERCKEAFGETVAAGVDTVGSIEIMNELMGVSRRFGHLVSAGFYGTADCFPLQPPRYRELSIDLVSGWTRDRMDRTLASVAAGDIETLSLITHRFPAREAAAAWDLIESKREPVLGVILEW